MSYLNALRLHFAGRFQANVSTVNNDPGHFDNASFLPSYQLRQGPQFNPPNGWFNPQGDAAWRFLGCVVSSAWTADGVVKADDPVLRCIVADSDSRAPAKLVDLDSEQQLVSEIWGLQVRIADASGNTLLRADFDPAAFIDIWDRATVSSGGDADAGAVYQSVLRNLQWYDVSGSAFLSALKAAAADGLLSIKFNVDSFNLSFTSPDFMTGRITGSIGPATRDEPRHLTLGRQFMAAAGSGGNFFTPAGGINFCVARVDAAAALIYLDLGNALQTGAGGTLLDIGDLSLGVYNPLLTPTHPAGSVVPIGTIAAQGVDGYTGPNWYNRTAGVVVLPIPADLLSSVQGSPLLLSSSKGQTISENPSGAFVRADTYVFRASPGDKIAIDVVATRYGHALPGAVVQFAPDSSQLQPSNNINPNDVPPVAVPLSALGFASASSVASATTDPQGKATLTLKLGNPGTPRWFNNGQDFGIDGQVYGIRPAFQNAVDNGLVNPWNFVSLLLWSGYVVPATPGWADVQPIFQQYANLYPVMLRFLDMGNEASVRASSGLLTLAFGLDPADPNAMPVTRDLSPAKRSTILAWLAQQPQQPAQTPRAPHAAADASAPAPKAALTAVAVANPPAPPPPGGKAAAAARRLILQQH